MLDTDAGSGPGPLKVSDIKFAYSVDVRQKPDSGQQLTSSNYT